MPQSNPFFYPVVIDLINARRGIDVDALGRGMVYHSVTVSKGPLRCCRWRSPELCIRWTGTFSVASVPVLRCLESSA